MSQAGRPESAKDILREAQEGRFVIEDFVPLTDSLEFDLGQQYWRERGSKAFTSDATPVPYTINNDGALSRRTAEVFFVSLVESEQRGPLEPTLYVLELGIGVGLFARFFLDTFQEICAREGKDYYRRLIYIAGDRSERMLADACRHGVFANHPGRYLIRVVDALEPARYMEDLVGPACRLGPGAGCGEDSALGIVQGRRRGPGKDAAGGHGEDGARDAARGPARQAGPTRGVPPGDIMEGPAITTNVG